MIYSARESIVSRKKSNDKLNELQKLEQLYQFLEPALKHDMDRVRSDILLQEIFKLTRIISTLQNWNQP